MDLFLKCVNNRFTLCMVTFFCWLTVRVLENCQKSALHLQIFLSSVCRYLNQSTLHQWLQDWLQHSMVKAIPMLNSWTSILLMKVLIHFFSPKHTFAYLAWWVSSADSPMSHICTFHGAGGRCTTSPASDKSSQRSKFSLSFAPELHFQYTLNSLQTSGSTIWKCFALSSWVGTTCFNLQTAMERLRGAISECIKL